MDMVGKAGRAGLVRIEALVKDEITISGVAS